MRPPLRSRLPLILLAAACLVASLVAAGRVPGTAPGDTAPGDTARGDTARGDTVPAGAGTDRVSLAGDWRYLPHDGPAELADPAVADADWPSMRLPSNWFLKGSTTYPVDADLKPLPRGELGNWDDYGKAQPERGLDYAGYMWFRRGFDVQPRSGRPVVLRFDSVDYFADVYVNGKLAGSHEGSFQPFELDVTALVKPGGNVVAVRVGAPALPYDWHELYSMSWPKRQAFVKGIFGYHDTRPGGTSERGQERGTGGIIGDVTLRSSPGVDIIRTEVAPLEVSEAKATLRIDYVLHNWTGREQRGVVEGAIALKGSTAAVDRFSLPVTVKPGEQRLQTTRTIVKPQLWWSWDYGTPYLYELRSTLGGGLSGEARDTFGIRSIRRDDQWVWYLNGRRIFPRGSNYISTQWLSQADRAWYQRDLTLIKAANLNSVRAHAHLERPEFYELADEMGLMVWQDFPLQWGYTDALAFHRSAIAQARDMVGLFFNHPSIIVWCMQNEAPHAMTWMKRKSPAQNQALGDALVAEARRLDPSRVHHRDSGTGDGHPYPGWYSGKAAEFAGVPGKPFITEYGAQALPGLETLRSMFPADVLWPDTPEDWKTWTFHNFQRRETFELARVPMGSSIDEFVRHSQNYQGALLKYATESYRRAKWSGVTGLYQFMFVDDWPSVTWSVVDYYRRPKRGYGTLKAAMQPVLPSIEYTIDDPSRDIVLWVVNDRHQPFTGARLRWRLGGREDSATMNVPSDGSQRVRSIGSGRAIAAGTDVLEVWLEDEHGAVLGRNTLEAADFISWKQ
jgi:beta-mannosidase